MTRRYRLFQVIPHPGTYGARRCTQWKTHLVLLFPDLQTPHLCRGEFNCSAYGQPFQKSSFSEAEIWISVSIPSQFLQRFLYWLLKYLINREQYLQNQAAKKNQVCHSHIEKKSVTIKVTVADTLQ